MEPWANMWKGPLKGVTPSGGYKVLLFLMVALTTPRASGQEAAVSISDSLLDIQSFPTPPPTLVHKCCPENQVFDQASGSCQTSHDLPLIVPTFTLDQYGIYREVNLTQDQLELRTGILSCSIGTPFEVREPFVFRVVDAGQLWVVDFEVYYPLDMYCLETFAENASVPGSPHEVVAAVCPMQAAPEPFDSSKIAIRKCCLHNQVYKDSTCYPRDNVTDDVWEVPLRPAGSSVGRMVHVDLRQQPYMDTHEVVGKFQQCKRDERGVEVHDFHVIEETGRLYVPQLQHEFNLDEYCVEDFFKEDIPIPTAYICVNESDLQQLELVKQPGCQSQSCARKCCPFGEIVDASQMKCIESRNNYFNITVKLEDGTLKPLRDLEFVIGYPDCGLQITYEDEDVQLLQGMNLSHVTYNVEECVPRTVKTFPVGTFCTDQILYTSGAVRQGALFCNVKEPPSEKSDVRVIYSIFLGISDLFILVSFIVYLTVPDQNKRGLNKNVKLAHSVLGRILLCFLFSMFFAYLFLIIINLFSEPINMASKKACIAVGLCMYMFFMATFFWLNVLCFEIWWKCSRQETSSGRRWLWYQVYAWFGPIMFGAISLIIDLTPSINSCYVKPNFGKFSCFFGDTNTHKNGAKWAYFFGPVAALLIADLVFFILTVRSLLVTVQQSHKGTAQKQAKQRLKLCFKLFLVMGISWFAEIISYELGPSKFQYITNIFNCSQGFIVFLIFILKPKIMEAVRSRLCGCCGRATPTKPRGPTLIRGTTEEEIATGSDVAMIQNSRTSQVA